MEKVIGLFCVLIFSLMPYKLKLIHQIIFIVSSRGERGKKLLCDHQNLRTRSFSLLSSSCSRAQNIIHCFSIVISDLFLRTEELLFLQNAAKNQEKT
jgi:hypothetical protein